MPAITAKEIKNCTGPDELKLHPLCLRDLVISLDLPAVPGSKSWISMKRRGISVRERECGKYLREGNGANALAWFGEGARVRALDLECSSEGGSSLI